MSEILKPVLYHTTIDGKETEIELPFTCAKYRTHARVVDFRPRRLENFACGRKVSEFDVLTDDDDDDDGGDLDSSDASDDGTLDRHVGRRVWEWRFALQLEDVSAGAHAKADRKKAEAPARVWVVVDNAAAQLLTGLDATDLRANPDDLAVLRERLFTLWGDLEEKKAAAADAKQKSLAQQRKQSVASGSKLLLLLPPPHSSDGEGDGDGHVRRAGGQHGEAEGALEPANKPFACCIKQYGIQTKVRGPEAADVRGGMRWERMFGLFGTKIGA